MMGFGAEAGTDSTAVFAGNWTLNIGPAAGVAAFGPHAPVLNAAALTAGLGGAWDGRSTAGPDAVFTEASSVPFASQ